MPHDLAAFDEIAQAYRNFRPSYPPELLAALAADGPISGAALDVGAGTGISTRQLSAALGDGWTVTGIEPGTGMLAASDGAGGRVTFIRGHAEALPANRGTVDLILAAQALQWFDRPTFYAEAKRVLRGNGRIAILQNNRRWQDSAMLAAYEALLERHNPSYDRHYRTFNIPGELADAGFTAIAEHSQRWSRRMSRGDFFGFALSSTKCDAVVRSLGKEPTRVLIEDMLDREDAGETVDIPYIAELFVGRKAEAGNGGR